MFIRAANPVWYFPDLIGQPLNDEYYAFFLTNTLPYLPQSVYRDPQGVTAWPNPLQFFPNGTLPNNLYFDPNLVYRIEIRRGNSQTDPLIYEINNFVPGEGATPSNNSLAILGTENQISNSQFSEVNFVSPLTITVAGVYQVAPGWDLVLTGSGSTTVSQLVLSGDQNQINNPPYALRVNNNGWTESYLRQRFSNNGALWADGAVTMSITARAQTVQEIVTLIYSPNSPGVPQQIATGILGTGDYQVLAGAIDLPASVNSTLSDDAYVDMIIQLPPTGIVDVSNVQVIGQSDPLPTNFDPDADIPTYQQQTNERMIDHLFHYYASQLILKPKKNLLVGWNFPLNPFQFITTTVTTVTALTSYICDQTILHQEAASQLQTGKNTVDQRSNLLVKAVTAATQTRFALIQYIAPQSIVPYWSYIVSALARARIFTTHGTSVRLKCRLIYRTSLPPSISNTEQIASWSAASDPTFAAGWTAIAPLNDPAYVLPNAYETGLNVPPTPYPAFSFDQFQLPDCSNADMTLGIVLYTMDNLDSTAASEDSIAFDKVSLIPSLFGADASQETFDQCLQECQFYYEKSYNNNVLPGTITNNSSMLKLSPTVYDIGAGAYRIYAAGFEIQYKTIKRSATPTVTFYSPSIGNVGTIDSNIYESGVLVAGSGGSVLNWGLSGQGQKSATYVPITGTVLETAPASAADVPNSGLIRFHYTADARLGV
jgi:hypothetical protein